MKINENDVSAIVRQVVAKLNLTEPQSQNGLFDDMNDAIVAAKKAQQIVKKMPLDAREKVIANILQLGSKSVRQIMTPRTVTFSVSATLTIKEAAKMEDKWRMHSRVPVFEGEVDNVVGIIPGTDPKLKSEAVVYSAHWDHLGIDDSKQGDNIWNGAIDNGSGTSPCSACLATAACTQSRATAYGLMPWMSASARPSPS